MTTAKTKATQSGAATKDSAMKIVVTQTRSACGRDMRVKGTLNALGLGRVGKQCEHMLTPSIEGMVERVKQIVRVKPA